MVFELMSYVLWLVLCGRYDSCSGEVTAMYADYRSVLHYGPGQEIQFIKYKCRVYSVGYILDTGRWEKYKNENPNTWPLFKDIYQWCVEPIELGVLAPLVYIHTYMYTNDIQPGGWSGWKWK